MFHYVKFHLILASQTHYHGNCLVRNTGNTMMLRQKVPLY